VESAEERMAAGEREQGIADYRRALALNPKDRVSLDRVEDALRGGGERSLLADHLAFRCAFAEGETRAALALEQAEILAGQGRIEEASAACRQALASDPDSLLALKGARRIAELKGDKDEVARLLAKESSLARNLEAMLASATMAAEAGQGEEAIARLSSVLEADPANAEAADKLRRLLGEDAASSLASLWERIGHAHADARLAALAWIQAGRIQLRELEDAPAAFFAAGRALSRDPENLEALELRADAGEAAGRARDAAEALERRLARNGGGVLADGWKLRLGKLHAQAGEAAKALPLLGPALDALEPATLINLASGVHSLPADDAIRLYRRVLDAFEAGSEEGPTSAELAAWCEGLGSRLLEQGEREQALLAFRRALRHEPGNVPALRQISELGTPEEAVEAQQALFAAHPSPEPIRALARLHDLHGRSDAAFCASAVLAGLESAGAEERAVYEMTASQPPPVDLPRIPDGPAVHAVGDEGPARDLFAAAMPELARAFATDMNGGRGALVKGDNPVRRVVAAIARALGMPEPQIHLARAEPAIVAPLAAETAGILVGAEVPKRWSPRQQRFLYARALAHIRRGSQAVAPLPPERLAALAGELARFAGVDLSSLAPPDPALAERLARFLGPETLSRLAEPAARLAAEEAVDWEALALGMRESAERVALALCGDPAAAISIVSREVQGGLERPEVCRLARFAISDSYLSLRAR
jgi:tetratricopeptide (TPR) repeat protein